MAAFRRAGLAVTLAAVLVEIIPLVSLAAGQYAQVSDDLELYYVDEGQGDPIVLIPGWTASEVVFEHQIDHLAKTHHVIAYDPRSQGLSTKTLDNNSYAQHGRDLAGLLDKLGLRQVTLIGWSAACYDIWAYVRDQGTDNIKRIVCIDMPPVGLSADPTIWSGWSADEEGMLVLRGSFDLIGSDRQGLAFSLAQRMNARPLTPAETDWFIRQAMLTPTYAALLLRADMLFSDYRLVAKDVDGKVPILYVLAEDNPSVAASWVKQNMPHAQIMSMKRHMSFWSEHDGFNAGLDAFLTSTP